MPKFQKGHSYGFKAQNLPHNKGKKSGQEAYIPATYKRLSSEMTDLVNNPPSASEREEMVQRPGNYHLLRPRGDACKSEVENHQDQNCEQ